MTKTHYRRALTGRSHFVFETTRQADGAIQRLLHVMTFQILLGYGRYPGREPLRDFDRIPLSGPICAFHDDDNDSTATVE